MQNKDEIKIEDKIQKIGTESAGFTPPPRPQALAPKTENVEEKSKSASEKPKKEGKELNKSQKQTIKKWSILGSIFLVLALGLYIGISLIMGGVKENSPLVITENSGQVSLIKSQEEYFLLAPYQSHAEVYYFEVKDSLSSNAETIEIESLSNAVSATGVFLQAGIYQVRFAIQKQNKPSTKSEFSPWVLLTSTQKLDTPTFEYDQTLKQFSWQNIANANAYKLYYFQNNELKNITITDYQVLSGMIAIDIESLQLDLGVYEFTLIAVNLAKDYFIASDYNKKIRVEHFEELEPVESGNYDIPTNMLSITLKEYKSNLKLKISYGTNQSITINLIEEALQHNFLLSQYNGLSFDATDTIEVSLVSANEFVKESNKVRVTLSN